MPSVASLVGSFVLALLFIGIHLLFLSMNPDLVLPHFFRGVNTQLIDTYDTSFLQPLNDAFRNSTLSTLTTALVWGVVGLVIYSVLDFLVTTIKDYKQSGEEVTMPGQKNQLVKHPLRRSFFVRLIWRFFIGMLVIMFTALVLPYVGKLFSQDIMLLRSDEGIDALKHLGIALGGWLLVFHIYVVLLRLFTQRTRVTGEIIY
jgi:hypothetical protein